MEKAPLSKVTDKNKIADDFRKALRQLSQNVAVVSFACSDSKKDAKEEYYGLTVTSFASLSMTPPCLMVAINQKSSSYPHLKIGNYFTLNLLEKSQSEIANAFSSLPNHADRYKHGNWQKCKKTSSPILENALANITCKITDLIPHHSHSLLIGEVQTTHQSHKKNSHPLLYRNSRYN